MRYAKRLWLDLGGIAKGYAVDEAVRVLQRQGLRAGIVNAGGDLRCFGSVETVAKRADQCVELADQLVLECELHLEVLEALGVYRFHDGKVADSLLRFRRASHCCHRSRGRRLLQRG